MNGRFLSGRWVSAREFSRLTGISEGLLGNWRTEDRKAGFIAPGRPVWRRFAGCVRYWLPDAVLRGEPDHAAIGVYRARKRSQPPTAVPEVSDAR